MMETRLSFTRNAWQFWTALSCFFDHSPDHLQRRFASEQIAADISGAALSALGPACLGALARVLLVGGFAPLQADFLTPRLCGRCRYAGSVAFRTLTADIRFAGLLT